MGGVRKDYISQDDKTAFFRLLISCGISITRPALSW